MKHPSLFNLLICVASLSIISGCDTTLAVQQNQTPPTQTSQNLVTETNISLAQSNQISTIAPDMASNIETFRETLAQALADTQGKVTDLSTLDGDMFSIDVNTHLSTVRGHINMEVQPYDFKQQFTSACETLGAEAVVCDGGMGAQNEYFCYQDIDNGEVVIASFSVHYPYTRFEDDSTQGYVHPKQHSISFTSVRHATNIRDSVARKLGYALEPETAQTISDDITAATLYGDFYEDDYTVIGPENYDKENETQYQASFKPFYRCSYP